MPPIKNAKELSEKARSRNFLNSSSPQFQTVNKFTQKLMDLQDKLKDNSDITLKDKVEKYARDLMHLQMHNTPMVSPDALSTSITNVTVDLPYYLKTPGMDDGKTGYQKLVEAGDQYGTFTKAELDEAMTLVGQGMDVDLGVDDPEKEKQKEAQRRAEEEAQRAQAEAEQQAVIDAQANIGILDEEPEAGEDKAEPEHKLLRAVEDRYYLAAELRDAPMPNHTHGGTTPSQYYNGRRDAEFGLEETRQRLQRQLSKMSSDQLDQVYLEVMDEGSMSKLSMADFQNKALDPQSSGSWLTREPFNEKSLLKLAEAMEKVLPPEQVDELAAEVSGIKPMSDPDYPKEEKYDYPVQNEIRQLKNSLPPEQQTRENLALLDEINEDTREVSEKYFEYIQKVGKSSLPFNQKTPLTGMEHYADYVMYAYTDEFLKSEDGKKYAKELEPAKGESRHGYYDVIYEATKVDKHKTPEFMKRVPELRTLESGISEETMGDIQSVVDDMNSLGPQALGLGGFCNPKFNNAPRAEAEGKTYALTAIGKAKMDLQEAVKTGDMEKIRKAHEWYKTVKQTTDHMMETARTKPELGQSEVYEGNMDALRGKTTPVPDEYLLDFAGHSKLAGILVLNNFSQITGIPMKEIMQKPVPAALKATDKFITANGINSGKTAGAKLVHALSAEKALNLGIGFAATTHGVIQRGLETLGGFAHSREEAQRLVGQAVLAQGATNGVVEAAKETWLNLANAGAEKQQRLYDRVLLTPEDQLNMTDLAEKFDKKNWKSELSTDKLLKDTVGKGGFDYEALIRKADQVKAEAEDEAENLSDDGVETNYRSGALDRATVVTFRKVLEAAPQQDRTSPGYQKLRAETERRTLELKEVKKAETDLDKQIEILAREKTGFLVSKENSAEHQQMMKSLQDLQAKKRMLRGDIKDISPEDQQRLKKISLDDAIRTARNDTMAYSRKVEEDGRKTKFRYASGATRANGAIHAVEALDEMADAAGGRTKAQQLEDSLQRETMDNRKDAQQVRDNAARSLYLSFIKANPEKYPPEKQADVLSNEKLTKSMEKIEKDPAFQKMMKSMSTDQLADKIISGPDAVLASYLDATKALNDQAIGKSGSEMTREERKEFMQNAAFAEDEKPKEIEL